MSEQLPIFSANSSSSAVSLDDIMARLERIEKYSLLASKSILTIDEATVYLGVSKPFLYQLTSGHEIPFHKPRGKLIYFDKKELDEWALQNRIVPNSEIEESTEVLSGRRLLEKYLAGKLKH